MQSELSLDAYTRLVITYLIEYVEVASRAYLNEQTVQLMLWAW